MLLNTELTVPPLYAALTLTSSHLVPARPLRLHLPCNAFSPSLLAYSEQDFCSKSTQSCKRSRAAGQPQRQHPIHPQHRLRESRE